MCSKLEKERAQEDKNMFKEFSTNNAQQNTIVFYSEY